MKRHLLTACLFSAATASAVDAKPLAGRRELADTFRAALVCQGPPVDARDPATKSWLSESKVRIIDHAPGEVIDLEYVFETPLQIEGVSVSKVIYKGDSGNIIYAVAQGTQESLAKKMNAKVVPVQQSQDYGYAFKAQYFRQVSNKPQRRLVVMGGQDTTALFGCRTFEEPGANQK